MSALHTVYSCPARASLQVRTGSQVVLLSEGKKQILCDSLQSPFDVCYAYFVEISMVILDIAGKA